MRFSVWEIKVKRYKNYTMLLTHFIGIKCTVNPRVPTVVRGKPLYFWFYNLNKII